VSGSALLAHDRARGVRLIAGVDEVGRACLAGPIVAAGVLFDLERLASGAGRDLLEEVKDSKGLGGANRERLALGVLEAPPKLSTAIHRGTTLYEMTTYGIQRWQMHL
jgi:ribonuclease HII